MLTGTRRSTVTDVLAVMQQNDAIESSRGSITIINRVVMKEWPVSATGL
jgi:hypothetical protein